MREGACPPAGSPASPPPGSAPPPRGAPHSQPVGARRRCPPRAPRGRAAMKAGGECGPGCGLRGCRRVPSPRSPAPLRGSAAASAPVPRGAPPEGALRAVGAGGPRPGGPCGSRPRLRGRRGQQRLRGEGRRRLLGGGGALAAARRNSNGGGWGRCGPGRAGGSGLRRGGGAGRVAAPRGLPPQARLCPRERPAERCLPPPGARAPQPGPLGSRSAAGGSWP